MKRYDNNLDGTLDDVADGRYVEHADHLAAIQQLTDRLAQFEASRIAYASEFALTKDGEPDVGRVHANIRALKYRLAKVERERDTAMGIFKNAFAEMMSVKHKLEDYERERDELGRGKSCTGCYWLQWPNPLNVASEHERPCSNCSRTIIPDRFTPRTTHEGGGE